MWNAGQLDDGVEFTYFSKDGEENYPGNLSVTVTFKALSDGLRIDYTATTDKPTPLNLTNHAYFNLSPDKESVSDHFIRIDADSFTPIDDNWVVTGETRKVEGTVFDFRKMKRIGEDIDKDDDQLKIAGGYDHNFVLNGSGFRKCVTVYEEKSGIEMDCYTDMPGLQFYSGNLLTERKIASGATVNKRYALCLETQKFPNSVNIDGFPNTILMPGEKFTSRTEYRFKSKI